MSQYNCERICLQNNIYFKFTQLIQVRDEKKRYHYHHHLTWYNHISLKGKVAVAAFILNSDSGNLW